MKKDLKEGKKLRNYLRDNEVNQEELAGKLSMTRQGLQYHLGKEKLDHEFRVKLYEVGVKAFDANGKWIVDVPKNTSHVQVLNVNSEDAEILSPTDMEQLRLDLQELAPLGQMYIQRLQHQLAAANKDLTAANKRIRELEKGEAKCELLISLQGDKIEALQEKIKQLSERSQKRTG